MKFGTKLTIAALLSSSALCLTQRALAEADTAPANPAGIQEVVVTAEKRSTTVQETPASISAVTGLDLEDRGITSLAALAQGTPGVSLKS